METETDHVDSYPTAAEKAKKEKRKERERWINIAFIVALAALAIGAAFGYISGYHRALVDFGIIAGSLV